ncbi:MAG: hypothetical protein U0703_18450 [Anaerolineae bacterium]
MLLVIDLIEALKIDDAVGAFAVHGACGALGCLVIGLFGLPALTGNEAGLLVGGGVSQLIAQVVGVAVPPPTSRSRASSCGSSSRRSAFYAFRRRARNWVSTYEHRQDTRSTCCRCQMICRWQASRTLNPPSGTERRCRAGMSGRP